MIARDDIMCLCGALLFIVTLGATIGTVCYVLGEQTHQHVEGVRCPSY
jgi:hypothetical protein